MGVLEMENTMSKKRIITKKAIQLMVAEQGVQRTIDLFIDDNENNWSTAGVDWLYRKDFVESHRS
jgi:hypothetical protein